jgi:hypothetical protein
LEGQLSLIFQVASHWGAVLLDEEDVYLERCSPQVQRSCLGVPPQARIL